MSSLIKKLFTVHFWILGLNDPQIAMNKNSIKFSYLKRFKGKSNWTLIDLGSHKGEFAERVSHYLTVTKYIFVDPNRDFNVELKSKFPESTIINKGVSTGHLPLNYIRNSRNPGQNFTSREINGDEKVPSITLTKIFESLVDDSNKMILKIDIEGDEVNVLKSLPLSLIEKIDVISLEITPISNSKLFLSELTEFLPGCFDFYRERRFGWIKIDRINPHWTDHLNLFQNLILVNRR